MGCSDLCRLVVVKFLHTQRYFALLALSRTEIVLTAGHLSPCFDLVCDNTCSMHQLGMLAFLGIYNTLDTVRDHMFVTVGVSTGTGAHCQRSAHVNSAFVVGGKLV